MEKINLHMSDEIVETFITKKAAMHHIETADYAAETFPTMWPDNGWHPGMEKRYLLVRMGQSPSGDYPMETIGYIHEDLRDDEAFWTSLCDDEGVMEILEPENEPHAGITCEYTGLVISEPWYFVEFAVDPTACDSDGNDFYQGAENALRELIGQAEQYAIEGWSLDHAALNARIRIGEKLVMDFTYVAQRYHSDIVISMICTRLGDTHGVLRHDEYRDPLGEVDDDDTESESSPRYRFIDSMRDFFYLKGGNPGFTYENAEGSLVMRQGEYARRFGTISRFEG